MHAAMASLGHAVADGFSMPGLPISKRFCTLLDKACDAFSMDQGYVTLVTPTGPLPKFQSTGAKIVAYEVVRGKDLSAKILTKRQVLAAPGGGESSEDISLYQDWSGKTPASFLGAPIIFDGRAYGTIEFSAARPRASDFQELELSMLRVLASYAAGPLVLLGNAIVH